MPYAWLDHTGELALEVIAPTREGVFELGFDAMAELFEAEADQSSSIDLAVEGTDEQTLFAHWLGELAYLAETERLASRLNQLELGRADLRASIQAARGAAPHLVKAVTYHGLTFGQQADGSWRATAVLDI